jgi:hypothetical protein
MAAFLVIYDTYRGIQNKYEFEFTGADISDTDGSFKFICNEDEEIEMEFD